MAPSDVVSPSYGSARKREKSASRAGQAAQTTRSSIIIMMMLFLGGVIARYILNVYLARVFDAADYGDYSTAYAVLSVIGLLSLLGSDQAASKLVPRQLRDGEFSSVAEFLLVFSVLSVGIGVVIAVVATIVHVVYFNGDFLLKEGPLHPVKWAVWLLPLYAMTKLTRSYFVAVKRPFWAVALFNVATPLTVIAGIYLFVSMGYEIRTRVAFAAFGAAYLAGLIQCFLVRPRNVPMLPKSRKFQVKFWIGMTLPLMANQIVWVLNAYFALILLEAFGPSEQGVGYFSAAMQVGFLILVPYAVISTFVLPQIGELVGRPRAKAQLQALYGHTMRIITLLVLAALAAVLLFQDEILSMFGHNYRHIGGALTLISINYSVICIGGISTAVLQYSGKQNTVAKWLVISALINIALCVVLIPQLGYIGAAWALLAASSFASLPVIFLAWRWLGLVPFLVPGDHRPSVKAMFSKVPLWFDPRLSHH